MLSLPSGTMAAMAKTAAQRRATRKRKEQSRSRRRPFADGVAAADARQQLVHRLVSAGARTTDAGERDAFAVELADLDPTVDETGFVGDLFLGVLQRMWEHGWQPADVAHVVRRQGSQRIVRLAAAAVAEEASGSAAASRAPQEWREQLAALDALSPAGPAYVAGWRRAERLSPEAAWRDVMELLGLLTGLPVLQQLSPPPSQWGGRSSAGAGSASATAEPKMLGRIRALLAKAESTDFPEEAEALSAKAQELMTRYAVDAAVLDAEHGARLADEVEARRVHVENPYPDAKVQLLNAVGKANGVRVIYLGSFGMATMIGLPVDLDLVDLLFTSLLVQATRAVAAAGRAGSRGARSPSFRRSFLLSYGIRIGERLAEVRDQATEEATATRGAALVPVLRERAEAVDDAFTRFFPETTQVETRASNLHGWRAGRLAAETADLGSGREQVRG